MHLLSLTQVFQDPKFPQKPIQLLVFFSNTPPLGRLPDRLDWKHELSMKGQRLKEPPLRAQGACQGLIARATYCLELTDFF